MFLSFLKRPYTKKIMFGFLLLVSFLAYYLYCSYLIFVGEFQIGEEISPLDPDSVDSIVFYGVYGFPLTEQATGYSLVYNQLYPFEGLQNYTSGIIHHVLLTGINILNSCIYLY